AWIRRVIAQGPAIETYRRCIGVSQLNPVGRVSIHVIRAARDSEGIQDRANVLRMEFVDKRCGVRKRGQASKQEGETAFRSGEGVQAGELHWEEGKGPGASPGQA